MNNTQHKPKTASAPETRTYATHKGERVEVIGEDSSDKSRAIILSSRGFTSYVPKSELQNASVAPESDAKTQLGEPILNKDGTFNDTFERKPLETDADVWLERYGINVWLWPDHTIGKRESRRLREEHNALVNHAEALAEALRGIRTAMERGLSLTDPIYRAMDELKNWEGVK